MNGASSRLELVGLALSVAGVQLFPPLDLTVEAGDTTTVMGPSGCGKSSLLAAICGTLDPVFGLQGDIRLGGRSLLDQPPQRRRVGILFQDDLLFPHLSVGENLAFGLSAAVRGKTARRQAIVDALKEAGLAGFEDRDPATLSGGQRARVAVMRVLLSRPQTLLLDEPFSKLDANLRNQFRAFVFDHARAAALPTLLVSHDPADATAAGGAVVELA